MRGDRPSRARQRDRFPREVPGGRAPGDIDGLATRREREIAGAMQAERRERVERVAGQALISRAVIL